MRIKWKMTSSEIWIWAQPAILGRLPILRCLPCIRPNAWINYYMKIIIFRFLRPKLREKVYVLLVRIFCKHCLASDAVDNFLFPRQTNGNNFTLILIIQVLFFNLEAWGWNQEKLRKWLIGGSEERKSRIVKIYKFVLDLLLLLYPTRAHSPFQMFGLLGDFFNCIFCFSYYDRWRITAPNALCIVYIFFLLFLVSSFFLLPPEFVIKIHYQRQNEWQNFFLLAFASKKNK